MGQSISSAGHAGPAGDVPVFNCVVNVAQPNAEGIVVARVANLAGMEARGKTEREALSKIVAVFKAEMKRLHTAGAPVPWVDPVAKPGPNESQRLIAVHL